jgi:hypothetical protein
MSTSRARDALCIVIVWMIVFAATVCGAPASSWWPAIFGYRSDSSSSEGDGEAARRGMHSAYLASKSSELQGLEGNLVLEIHRRARTSSCWKDAVAALESRCQSELLQEDQRSRMALRFTACQLHHDGKVSWESARSPHRCASDAEIADCVGLLEDHIYPLYIQFRLHVDTLCFHAQEELFQERTETAVSALDRVSSAALARTKDLSKRSTELVQSLDDSRRAQGEILTQTRATSDWLQGQYLAHQDILGTIARHATVTSQRVSELGVVFDEAKLLHQEALTNVKGELTSVFEAQQSAAASAKALATSLTTLAASSEAQMQQHQSQLEHVAVRTQKMAEDAATQQQHFLQSHSTMIELLERVFSTQQYIAGSASVVEKIVVYVCGSIVVLVATSLGRVASCRSLCLLALMMGWYAETYHIDVALSAIALWRRPLAARSPGDGDLGNGTHHHHRDAPFYGAETLQIEFGEAGRCIRHLVAVAVCALLLRAACRYVSPEESHRRLIVTELERWWGRLQADLQQRNSHLDGHHHSPDDDGWWDQGDGTMCTGDVWTPPAITTKADTSHQHATTEGKHKKKRGL